MQRMPREEELADAWPQSMNHDAMVGVADDEFTNFLDLDSGFEQYQQLSENHGHSGLDTPMGRLAFGGTDMQQAPGHVPANMHTMDMSMTNSPLLPANYQDMMSNVQQQQQQQQQMRQQFQPYHMYQQMNPNQQYRVPPTPVSAEMHAAKYTGQVDGAGQMIIDRNQASFTPLVSPAQTPMDNSFCMPEYVTADDFFSPLTSPAIEAQPPFSTNATASPVDLNAEGASPAQLPLSNARKGRRKTGQPTSRGNTRSVRQSPAMKPVSKRRQFSLESLPISRLQTAVDLQHHEALHPASAHPATFASSEDSVSPEPLSESLMRPPPVPSSHTRSPAHALQAKSKDDNVPATPAMIMRMPGKQSGQPGATGSSGVTDEIMEDISLPAAADGRQHDILPNSGTLVASPDSQDTPTIPAKTPKLSADSTPRSSAMKTSNNSNDSVDKIKRPDTRTGPRIGKKRQSVSSAAISPALRPKISPSISPLVPANPSGIPGLSAETSALYLASKSNYQNILDGTHLPGVSYPETLAENLSSKRTSHKIAEQGRRNRINLALKEIESLLPPSIVAAASKGKSGTSTSKEGEEGSPDKPSNGGQGASKASTVEMAIVYIKSLQAELKETKQKLEAAEKTILDGNSGSSQASEAGTS